MENLHLLNGKDPRPYPVVKAHPSFWEIVNNFNERDYALILTVGGVFFPLGHYFASAPLKRVGSVNALLIGLLGGFFLSHQNSAGRLMGLKPNAREVHHAGQT